MNIKKSIITGAIAALATTSFALAAPIANAAVTSPKAARGTWYGTVYQQTLKYKIGKKHVWVYDDYKKGQKNKGIKYTIEKPYKGYYGVKPTSGQYESSPFKISGKTLLVEYDTQIIHLHKK
ncbi:hypothetical protein [Nicoliella lavandulae]|uniref:Uncharacterized protein n=1 Tax=Nicoliella lavandulae TaxID=3082954 RepID=A0ABU8SLW7_9LACO